MQKEEAEKEEAREREEAIKAVEEQNRRDRDKGKRAEEASDMETEEEGHRKKNGIRKAAKKADGGASASTGRSGLPKAIKHTKEKKIKV